MKSMLFERDKPIYEEANDFKEFLTRLYQHVISLSGWYPEEVYDIRSGIYAIESILNQFWSEHKDMQERKMGNQATDRYQPDFMDYIPDEYYPRLQALSWPSTRRKRFDGNILLLSQHEVNDEFSFYENLFLNRGIKGWKKLLNKWAAYALNAKETILGEGKENPASVYKNYLQLMKAVERAWLNKKQQGDLLYHETYPWFDMHNYPVFSSGDYRMSNPYDELYGLFHSKSLMDYKRNLVKWIQVSCDTEKVWDEQPDSLVTLFKDLCFLTECCWLIRVQGPNYPSRWNDLMTHYTYERAEEPETGYQFDLPVSMINTPENYLKCFFDRHTINDVFDILFECLYTALGHEESYPYSFNEIRETAGECACLLEAAYLIQKKKYPDRDDRDE